ncbi:hypothetical protein ACS0TY_035867 [Phlomoides rotata]
MVDSWCDAVHDGAKLGPVRSLLRAFVIGKRRLKGATSVVDRATLWIEGRKNKDGELEGDELKEKAKIIFSFIEQKKDGGSECEVEGGILSQALESKEHYGRLRGIGTKE